MKLCHSRIYCPHNFSWILCLTIYNKFFPVHSLSKNVILMIICLARAFERWKIKWNRYKTLRKDIFKGKIKRGRETTDPVAKVEALNI